MSFSTGFRLFLGSSAFWLIMMLLSTITYSVVVSTCASTAPSIQASLVICLIIFFQAGLFYARSLYVHAGLSRVRAYCCLTQALLCGSLLGFAWFQFFGDARNPWWYMDGLMIVAMFIILVHDVGVLAFFLKKSSLSAFFQRYG